MLVDRIPDMLPVETNNDFSETLSISQREFLDRFFAYKMTSIVWDLDQVLAVTEEPVKKAFDSKFGTNYAGRKIDRWRSLSHWAHEDGIMDYEEAKHIEDRIWADKNVVFRAPPGIFQEYSRVAAENGIEQAVATSRPLKFEGTYEWMRIHYPWIPKGNVHQRKDDWLTGEAFKMLKIVVLNPNVHVEDQVEFTRNLIRYLDKKGTDTRILLFPRAQEAGQLTNGRVIEFAESGIWEDLYSASKPEGKIK